MLEKGTFIFMDQEKLQRHRYLKQKRRESHLRYKQERKKLNQKRLKAQPELHQTGEIAVNTKQVSAQSKDEQIKTDSSNTVSEKASVFNLGQLLHAARQSVRKLRVMSLQIAFIRLLVFWVGIVMVLLQTEKILHNLYYRTIMDNYHMPVNYLALFFGVALLGVSLITSKIYLQTGLYFNDHQKSSRHLRQFSSTLMNLTFFAYVFELLIGFIYLACVVLTTMEYNPILFNWTFYQRLSLVICLILSFLAWTYLQLLIPVSIKLTLGFWQTITYTFKVWWHNFGHICLMFVYFLPWTLAELFTVGLFSLYVYPYKLAAINELIKNTK